MDDQSATIEIPTAETRGSRLSATAFDWIEHAAYVAVGVLISVVALISLGDAVLVMYQGLVAWDGVETIGAIIERLLFVLMLAEILHTVRASMRSGGLSAEPFLIVGMIACIRRVLVSTLKSEATGTIAQSDTASQGSMLELAVLGLLILIMVVSIYILRRARPAGDAPAPPAPPG